MRSRRRRALGRVPRPHGPVHAPSRDRHLHPRDRGRGARARDDASSRRGGVRGARRETPRRRVVVLVALRDFGSRAKQKRRVSANDDASQELSGSTLALVVSAETLRKTKRQIEGSLLPQYVAFADSLSAAAAKARRAALDRRHARGRRARGRGAGGRRDAPRDASVSRDGAAASAAEAAEDGARPRERHQRRRRRRPGRPPGGRGEARRGQRARAGARRLRARV